MPEADLRGKVDLKSLGLESLPVLAQFADPSIYQQGDNVVLSATWDGAVKPLASINPMMEITYIVTPTIALVSAMRQIQRALNFAARKTPAEL